MGKPTGQQVGKMTLVAAAGVGAAWSAWQWFAARRQAPQVPTVAGYKRVADADGKAPPAHWHKPSTSDAMDRRLPGSFETGKRR